MRSGMFIAAALSLLAGCADMDDIRQKPVVWTAAYPGSYDDMAHCASVRMGDFWSTATPLIKAQERRAEVLVYDRSTGGMLFKYDFRETATDTTEASIRMAWRSTPLAPDNVAIDVLKRCSKPA